MKINAGFWDTSAIVPLCCRQEISPEVRKLWRQSRQVVVWWGATVEAWSAFSRLQRGHIINAKELHYAAARLDIFRRQWSEITPTHKLRDLAESLPEAYGLKALDAFQLAAALVWCKEKPKGRLFVCDDEKLSHAATQAGFIVAP